jgi:hypothetical protein
MPASMPVLWQADREGRTDKERRVWCGRCRVEVEQWEFVVAAVYAPCGNGVEGCRKSRMDWPRLSGLPYRYDAVLEG